MKTLLSLILLTILLSSCQRLDCKVKPHPDLESIKKEVEESKRLFKKNNWPIIDVTRRSVEETAASILKIIEIKKNK